MSREVVPQDKIWVPFNKEWFPVGTVGYSMFEALPDGHIRPKSMVGQPVQTLFEVGKDANILSDLAARKIVTAGDFLTLANDMLPGLDETGEVLAEKVRRHFLVLPHARLIGTAFEHDSAVDPEQHPVPPRYETGIKTTVDGVVARLDTDLAFKQNPLWQVDIRSVVVDRFGIEDGITRSAEELATKYNIRPNRVEGVVKRALEGLRKLVVVETGSNALEGLLALPENSIGSRFFGIVLKRDVPLAIVRGDRIEMSKDEREGLPLSSILEAHFNLLKDFSSTTQFELRSAHAFLADLYPVFAQDLSVYPLSQRALEETVAVIHKVVEQSPDPRLTFGRPKLAKPQAPELVISDEQREEQVQFGNNLIPEADFTLAQMEALRNIPIRDFLPIKRKNIQTVGDILGLSKEEYIKFTGDIDGGELIGGLVKLFKSGEGGALIPSAFVMKSAALHESLKREFSKIHDEMSQRHNEWSAPKTEKWQQHLTHLEQERQKRDEEQRDEVLGLIKHAQASGATTPEEVRKYIATEKKKISGSLDPRRWYFLEIVKSLMKDESSNS